MTKSLKLECSGPDCATDVDEGKKQRAKRSVNICSGPDCTSRVNEIDWSPLVPKICPGHDCGGDGGNDIG